MSKKTKNKPVLNLFNRNKYSYEKTLASIADSRKPGEALDVFNDAIVHYYKAGKISKKTFSNFEHNYYSAQEQVLRTASIDAMLYTLATLERAKVTVEDNFVSLEFPDQMKSPFLDKYQTYQRKTSLVPVYVAIGAATLVALAGDYLTCNGLYNKVSGRIGRHNAAVGEKITNLGKKVDNLYKLTKDCCEKTPAPKKDAQPKQKRQTQRQAPAPNPVEVQQVQPEPAKPAQLPPSPNPPKPSSTGFEFNTGLKHGSLDLKKAE